MPESFPYRGTDHCALVVCSVFIEYALRFVTFPTPTTSLAPHYL